MIVSLVALFPSHLNLNGDLANIRVLQQQLAWRGVESSVSFVEKGNSIPQHADFILLGHGSEAAWNDLELDLRSIKTELVDAFEQGMPGLAVASGFERLYDLTPRASLSLFREPVLRTERSSRFALAELDGNQALGYLNSDAELPLLTKIHNLYGTLLHGPILAKNQWLVDSIMESIFERRLTPLPEIRAKEKADQVADLISKIWELEEPLTRE
jgi:CobQ-like glutamine amidotransferase family enzyme